MDIKLPELGEGIESGDVLSVLVAEGDTVAKDQGLVELETDKASVEIPSTHAGKVTKIHVSEGDTLNIGGVIVSIETSEAEAESADPKDPPLAASQEAESAEPSEPTEPTEEQPAPAEEVKLSEAPQKQAAKAASQPAARTEPAKPQAVSVDNGDVVPAGPAMRRFAREVGVDLRNVEGSGEGGRITRGDVLRVVREGTQSSSTASAGNSTTTQTAEEEASLRLKVPSPAAEPKHEDVPKLPLPDGEQTQDDWGPIRVAKMPKIRQTIAAKMHESWSTIPRVTNFDDADVTELEQVRQASKADYASAGIKLTQMPFVIKACAMALRANPIINASIDEENGQIIYKEYVNIGIAVDTDRGLVVPSLRNADKLSIPDIARHLATLAENVRSGKFGIEDLRGGTFTISNLGAIGGTYSTPIINPPEVAILLLGRSRKMPVVVDHQFAVRLQMPLSLSYDHRLVDGAAAARFLNDIKGFLQSPSRLLLAP